MNIGSILMLTPTINFARRDKAQADVVWGPRIIPDCQFVYVIEGEAELLLNQKLCRIKAGECVFYGTDSPHRLRSMTEVAFYSVHFHWTHASPEPVHPAHRIRNCSFSDLSRPAMLYELDIPRFGVVAIPHWFDVPELEPLFMRIVKEYQAEKPGYAFMLRALLMELISVLVRHLTERSAAKRMSKIEPALEAMRTHPGQQWTVERLARLCGYHPIHFAKLFKEETGRAPKHYLISEKIKQAKQLLLNGESLETIAGHLDYNSIHYFSHQFKKETGLSPSEYRQQGNRQSTDN